MIDPTISYARHGEDVVIAHLFADQTPGGYVDIGAGHPLDDSATKLLYQRGWRGLDVAVDDTAYALLRFDRPEDTVQRPQSAPDLATLVDKPKAVRLLRIASPAHAQAILQSNNWQLCRPELICVVSGAGKEWRPLLAKNGYHQVGTNGFTEYFAPKAAAVKSEKLLRGAEPALHRQVYAALQTAARDRRLYGQRVERAIAAKTRAEWQANWYEHAPLSWLLRKTARAFDRAATKRLAPQPPRQHLAYASLDAPALSATPTLPELQVLRQSYAASLQSTVLGGPGNRRPLRAALWLGYRAVRKVARLVLGPLARARKAGEA